MEKNDRHSIRLNNYDYSQAGTYFLTLCVDDRKCLFGDILNGQMQLNEIGNIVANEWLKSAEIRNEIILDEWIVMPNHFHGIVTIAENNPRKGDRPVAPTTSVQPTGPKPKSIGALMAGFKCAVTKNKNLIQGTPGKKLWQRNYWEHIIRNSKELNQIRKYIKENPINWEQDRLNGGPGNIVLEPHAIYNEKPWMV